MNIKPINVTPMNISRSDESSELPKDLKGACKAMEEQFMNILLSTMRKSTMGSESKGADGFSKEVSFGMFDSQIAKLATEDEGMGLWKMLYDQLSPMESVKSEKSPADKNDGGIVRQMGHIIG